MVTTGRYQEGVPWVGSERSTGCLGAAAEGCGLFWERDLEEQEELCAPGTRDCCSSCPKDWGGTGLRCGELEKLCGSLLLSWLSLGELRHTVLNVLFQAENQTKPKSRFGTRQLQVSRGEAMIWQGWEDLVMECPSLGKGRPFSRGGAAAVWRTWLYAVVSDKDSWNNEANLSLYLRMLFCCC